MRDCPTVEDRGREGKPIAPNVPNDDARIRGVSMHSRLEDQSWIRVMIMMVSSGIYYIVL